MLSTLTRWLNAYRRAHPLHRRPLDEVLWCTALERLPFIAHLSAADLVRLRELTQLFLAQKRFSVAEGLDLTPEMEVAIAVQACLPILNLGLELYQGWVGIIIYPGEFMVRKTLEDETGVVHEIEHDASGEAWEGGPVVLSWEDVQMTDSGRAYNVVIHEFAHKIDMLNGEADGHPPLFRRWHAPLDTTAWAEVFDPAYVQFCAQVDAVAPHRWNQFEEASLIDPYAADHPAEFFAVCSEVLFVQPDAFHAQYPALYQLLADYYRQDPARAQI
ncbi:zinc-dependent peptidase [Paraburkholderia bonniea]|uniref:M90 family metallopeptidase n=1 Tax=Paraburkholderia bonniea TaxID=2152891 RepID=UPI001290CC03|nr:M90 family metallopeptidase [Paraburkholderia bonniea]WJF88978.1 zinc-dependent peptidase [Paraburkholderia bonniea]WJF92294.1 zinc-dependent peptidase [Paraburkholderia bonniea]